MGLAGLKVLLARAVVVVAEMLSDDVDPPQVSAYKPSVEMVDDRGAASAGADD
jgi:hypothetical protein